MKNSEFRKAAHLLSDWMAEYTSNIGRYPVVPDIRPGDIKKQLPASAPEIGEPFDSIFRDFEQVILPGMTHWKHPRFFAYFPTGSSAPSILADMLSSSLGAQCMIWLTSPAAEELEERMMEWMRDMTGLPREWVGVIQDSSSSANLVAILTAREYRTNYEVNRKGFEGQKRMRVYTSTQAHSSVEKDTKIAGIGLENLVKIETDENFAMIPGKLEEAIRKDLEKGYFPLCIVSTIGTTSSTAVDPVGAIGEIAGKYGTWHHIDASYSGTALILPEMRWMSKGIELADSYVVNPHKWMFTNFDCSAYFVRDRKALTDTFSILPEYLKTPEDRLVNNYRDWGVPLGRRFRALKLWFVLRSFGAEGLRHIIRNHISYGQWFKEQVEQTPGFELMAPVPVNLVCFRLHPENINDEAELERLNTDFLSRMNKSGEIFLTQTKLNGKYVIRFVAGQEDCTLESVKEGWEVIRRFAIEVTG